MEYDAFSSTMTQNLVSCGNCGRNFNPDALARHGPICAKTANKKRKVYDMSKHRAEGTDLEEHKRNERFKGGGAQRKPPPAKQAPARNVQPAKKNNWRQQHEEFISAIRAAKGVSKALATGAPLPPPPPPTINPDYEQCEFCARRFNRTAYERHVKFCKEQHERLPNKKQPSAAAVQRATARTAYKVPKPKAKTVTSPTSTGYGTRSDYGSSHGNMSGRPPGGATSNRGASTRYGRGGGGAGGGVSSNNSDYGPSSGRALRTGRTAETYSEARELSAKQRTTGGTARSPGYGGGSYSPHSARGGYNTHTGPTRGGGTTRNGDLGYHSGDSDLLTSKQIPRGGSGIARFCHECGTKYATTAAKFCSECGVKRVAVN